MPSALPDGDAVPESGPLAGVALEAGRRPLSFYLHVPYCATRCGYCDFNTYTSSELGSAPGAARDAYLAAAAEEIRRARQHLGDRVVSTVFVGGGTPTLLEPGELGGLLGVIRDEFGLAPGAEVTTEANPETITPGYLDGLLTAGFTRLSLGMQSVEPHVLAVLDRVHSPGRPQEAARQARRAGFGHVSLDLIYGTPGETVEGWRRSLESALEAEPDHISAYALIVEDGTRLASRVRRGEVPMTDDDDLADKYLVAESVLAGAGLGWYEISNWARSEDDRCRHNLAYWLGHDWWGVGPGAHSHVGGVRWWNVKHPAAYTGRIASGGWPAAAREVLGDEDRRVERVLLELRLADGLPLDVLTETERARVPDIVGDGLGVVADRRLVLTLDGRLLADKVIRDLLD